MGKKGDKRRGQEKRAKKRAIKASNRARYDAMRDAGENSKSKRFKKRKAGERSNEKGKHLIDNCGNVGCQKCHPRERGSQRVYNQKESVKIVNDFLNRIAKGLPVKKAA